MVRRRLLPGALILVILLAALQPGSLSAAQLVDRSLQLSTSQAATTATWKFGFQVTSSQPIAAIGFQICANDPFPNTACQTPVGIDTSQAQLRQQSGNTGFTVSPLTTTNLIVLERPGAAANQVTSSYELTGIQNPSANGSYFVRIQTYQTSYPDGPGNNYGGISFAISPSVNVTATVPPYLLFCVGITIAGLDCENVSGNYVDFGEFNSRRPAQGTTQMLAASNAVDGYTIRVSGPTLTSGNNVIDNLIGSSASRSGVAQFGLNLRANSSPQGGQDVNGQGSGLPTNGYNQINNYRFNAGDVVAVSRSADLARKYTATYIVNIPAAQPPGIYVSTLTYVALGSF